MLSLLKSKSDELTVKCPMCRAVKMIKKTDIKENKNQKAISFRCACGQSFHKKIVRKDFNKIDIISAIANFDIEVIWYKIHSLIFFFGKHDNEKISLA